MLLIQWYKTARWDCHLRQITVVSDALQPNNRKSLNIIAVSIHNIIAIPAYGSVCVCQPFTFSQQRILEAVNGGLTWHSSLQYAAWNKWINNQIKTSHRTTEAEQSILAAMNMSKYTIIQLIHERKSFLSITFAHHSVIIILHSIES